MTRPMDPLFDERIAEWLEADADKAPGEALEVVLAALPSITQQRGVRRLPRSLPRLSMPTRLAAAAVIGVLAVSSAVYVTRPGQPAIGGPTTTSDPSPSPSHAAVVVPSATATATPTALPIPTPAPILWTQASLQEDWPGPVRPEPAGSAILLPILVTRIPVDSESCCLVDEPGRHIDPSGDTESDVHPWVDIRELTIRTHLLMIELVLNLPPDVDSTEQWIAYGVVFDDDRDGVPDLRFGMDNSPRPAWMTDLHTGRTLVSDGAHVGETFLDKTFPGEWGGATHGARFSFGGDAAGGGTMGTSLANRPFYAWASVIQNGRIVATDYAPDAGWLDPSVKTTAGPGPLIQSSPGPTPQVANDPDVPGGRLWTVTVVNNSSKPATLVVAEDDGSDGMGRLVGTATPSAVPPDTTMKVIFHLPAIGGNRWWIFVNPGPDPAFLVNSSDVPAYGEFRIGADGSAIWRSLSP